MGLVTIDDFLGDADVTLEQLWPDGAQKCEVYRTLQVHMAVGLLIANRLENLDTTIINHAHMMTS